MLFRTLALIAVSIVSVFSATASAQTIKRDLQEWLNMQGTTPTRDNVPNLFTFWNDPDINEDGIPDGPQYVFQWDYADVMERRFDDFWGTEVTGRVTERPLGDGTSHLIVALQVTDASIWVVEAPYDCFHPTLDIPCALEYRDTRCTAFGFREEDVAAGETPALVDGYFRVEYIIETGAALGDIFFEQLLSFQMHLKAEGPLLTDECGVDTGRVGRLTWGKPGMFDNPPALDPTKDHGAGLLFPNDNFHLFEIRSRKGRIEPAVSDTSGFVRGDANSDGGVDIADLLFVLNYLYHGAEAPECLDAADLNDDGAIDVSDPIHGLSYLFVGGTTLPPPYPESGGDPTADPLICLR